LSSNARSAFPPVTVAVVARIVSADEILVDHANWYRGTVSRGMSVIDTLAGRTIGPAVAVLHTPSGTHGADYPTYGFIYPTPARPEIIEAHDRSGFTSYAAYEKLGHPPYSSWRVANRRGGGAAPARP